MEQGVTITLFIIFDNVTKYKPSGSIWVLAQKHGFFASCCLIFLLFIPFYIFHAKNVKKYFDQCLECAGPKCWLKYTKSILAPARQQVKNNISQTTPIIAVTNPKKCNQQVLMLEHGRFCMYV